jgi:uncharacterized protein YuzE
MKVTYDHTTDSLKVVLNGNLVAESVIDKPGAILDYDRQGNLVSLEVLEASMHVSEVRKIEFETTG